jgi:hypothetical protein
VFRATDNRRFLASPDGLGVDFDDQLVLSEIKTSKDDIAPGTEHFVSKGYRAQMVWQMRVMGARRCVYAWEQHDSDWQDRGGSYLEPAPLYEEPLYAWVEYDEKLAAELEAIALDFLAALDSEREVGAPVIDDELDTMAVNVLRFREEESSAKKAKEKVWDEILTLLDAGEPFGQRSAFAQVTYTPGSVGTEEVPDVQAAKDADPDLVAEMAALSKRWNEHAAKFKKTVPTESKPKLTITSVKAAKEPKK